MKILVVGARGNIGKVVVATLAARGHEVVPASRSARVSVDITSAESIGAMFSAVGEVDGIVVATGTVPFKPLAELEREDYLAGFVSKTLGQIEIVRQGMDHVASGGSITLTSGVLAREPIATGAAAAMANGALESFVLTAAAEAPRGIRINAVSPNVLANSPHFHPTFPGQRPVSDEEIGRSYVLSVEGIVTGRVIAV
ncbi:short chain dehydrogenase [Actinomycetaceae bacterium L2_0104]